jgi:PAS domain S-box-containing protein
MILLAINSRTVLLQAEHICTQDARQTLSASTLQQARAHLAANPVQAIVLDDWFPDGRGADLLRELREAGSDHVPVISIGSQSIRDPGAAGDDESGDWSGHPPDASIAKADLTTRLPGELRRLLRAHASGTTPGRILVVDDSRTYRELLRASLEAAGYTVRLAKTGEEAVRSAFEEPPDAMLVDSMLPGISGATVIRRLRGEASTRRTPCLLLTASEDARDELEALEAGADSFVRKDEEIAIILARLAGVLRSTSTPAATRMASLPQLPRRLALIGQSPGPLDAIGTILLDEGCEIVAMPPLQATLARCAALQPDVLIFAAPVDQALLEFCRDFKDQPGLRNSRLLLLDQLAGRNEAVAAIGAGADDYLPATAERAVILARARSQLRRKRVEDENRGLREHMLRQELETEAQRALAEARSRHADEMRIAYGLAERKAQEAERARLELEQITESIPQIVWTSAADGRNPRFNRRWTDYTGLPQHATSNSVWRRFIHPEDVQRALRAWAEAFRTGAPYTTEYRLRSAAGIFRWFLVRALPLADETGRIDRWFGTCTDIQDQKLSEEALRRTEKLAATGRLAASIAHEINNPLEAVTNLLYLIELGTQQAAETHGYVVTAQKELDRVAQISKKTLAFYRESTEVAEVDVGGLVKEVDDIYSERMRRKGIHLRLETDCHRRPQGLAGELRQVISNLVTNAIDASSSGSEIRVRVHDARGGPDSSIAGVRVTVGDHGHGIPASLLDDLFKPFITTKGQRGTGLGLWLSRSIVERHGGTMSVHTSTGPHHGTTFSVFLPLQMAAPLAEGDSMSTMLKTIGKELLGQS